MAPRRTSASVAQDGPAIKAARYARKLTTTQLGDLAGVSSATVSKAEREVYGIHLERLERIAKALEVPVTDLLREPYKSRVGALNGGNGSAA